MNIDIRFSRDAALISRMNQPVQELHFKLYPEYFKAFSLEETTAFMAKQLEAENWHCIISSVDGKDIGYALFFVRDYPENPFRKPYKGIHIDQISILPEFKNMGIGRAMMDKIEAFAKKEQATQIELTHWELNEDAKGFYAHLGFATNFRFVAKGL